MKPNHVYPIKEFKRNYDGGSFHLRFDLGFDARFAPRGGCRLEGVDTPEMRGGTEMSKTAARLAKDYAHDFIAAAVEADGVFISRGFDKYGRPLGDVCYIDSSGKRRSLAKSLVTEFLAVPYHGQNKAEVAELHAANLAALRKEGRI